MMTFVIDGLDECNTKTRAELLQALQTVLQISKPLVKILVSSRDDGDTECELENYRISPWKLAKMATTSQLLSDSRQND